MTSTATAILPGKVLTSVLPSILVAALGVVYGDIGTSPLYAFRKCFRGPVPLAVTTPNVLGVLSLIFWSLLIISLKYMVFILRTDNRGEGGIFALIALLTPAEAVPKLSRRTLLLVGLFGASLLYGDALITPAISVLSAVEGLGVRLPASRPLIVPVAAGILIALFMVQRRGTAGIGAVFGPVMPAWFALIASLGVRGIVQRPLVLATVNPWYAIAFLYHNEWTGFFILAAVFLVVTGGCWPIVVIWCTRSTASRPAGRSIPSWFSLTHQAIQLGLMPRLAVRQTSAAALALVVGFGSSSRLAAAYGLSVNGTMAITTW